MAVQYCAISAKLKAMHKGCLKNADLEEMLKKKSVRDIYSYLRDNTVYHDELERLDSNDVHRGQIEAMLKSEIFSEFERVYNFMDLSQKRIMKYWFRRYEIEFLKDSIRYIFNGETSRSYEYSDEFMNFFVQHSKINTELAQKAQNFEEFIEACKDSMYYNLLARSSSINADCFSICMMLDSFYYQSLWKAKDKYLSRDEAQSFGELIGSRIDMLNIIWIYRGKKYFKFEPDMIYTYLIPVGRLTRDNIRMLVEAQSVDEMINAAAQTKYAALFDQVVDGGYYVEEQYRRLLKKFATDISVKHPLSMAAVLAYFYQREAEINVITTIIEGVRYSIDSKLIKQHIF